MVILGAGLVCGRSDWLREKVSVATEGGKACFEEETKWSSAR